MAHAKGQIGQKVVVRATVTKADGTVVEHGIVAGGSRWQRFVDRVRLRVARLKE